MQTQNLFAIATLTVALTGAVFGQLHPDTNKVKSPPAHVQSIKSPRDSASGQATGKAAREAGSGMTTGRTRQVRPGQNSGGTISNQLRKPFSPKLKGYINGGVEHQDTWEANHTTKRTATPQGHDKYANQEVSYRRNPRTTQVTHDADFEQWASLKRKRSTR